MRRPVFPDQPYGDGPLIALRDLPRYAAGLGAARVLRRNPPLAPWWRRYMRSWQCFEPRLETVPRPDDDVLVYGLAIAWNEDDVVHATVRNLFDQGADRVFVVDDGSDDATAAEAEAAGASVQCDRSDGVFDEHRKTARLARVVEEETAAAGRPVWWLVVDADEFPRGPDGRTVRDLVRHLPAHVDTVGSRVLDHYPGRTSAPVPREHPLAAIPDARWCNNAACAAGHWKHQLVLVREPGEVRLSSGQHTVLAPAARKPLVEGAASLLMHHFPLRARDRMERKFRLAASAAGRYTRSPDAFSRRRLEQRLRMLEVVYDERYDLVPNVYPGEPRTGVRVVDWRRLVPPAEAVLPGERTSAGTPGRMEGRA